MKRIVFVVAYGLAGILLAFGLTLGAFALAGQPIGEPVEVVRVTPPEDPDEPTPTPSPTSKRESTPTPKATETPRATETPDTDDHGGEDGSDNSGSGSKSSGSGSGGSGSDDRREHESDDD